MAKNFYITTPIYYPSGNHTWVMLISIVADIFARFKRLKLQRFIFNRYR